VALAVDDAQTAAALLERGGDEAGEAGAGFVAGETVEIQFALHHPASAAQVGEHPTRQADAQIGGLVAGVEAVFESERRFEGFPQDFPFVGFAFAR